MRRTALLALVLLAPAALALAQNDAGTGGDAPDSQFGQLVIDLESWEGDLHQSADDYSDLYRILPPPGQVLSVTFETTNATRVAVLSSTGGTYASAHGCCRTVAVLVGDHVDIRLSGDVWGPVHYWVSTALTPPPDLLVRDLAVTPPSLLADGQVRFTVENLGGPTVGGSVGAYAVHTNSVRSVGYRPISMAPGEAREISIPWDGTGEVGDVKLVAYAAAYHDIDRSNDRVATTTAVIVGGTGVGIDPLNHHELVSEDMLYLRSTGTYSYRQYEFYQVGFAEPPFLFVWARTELGIGDERLHVGLWNHRAQGTATYDMDDGSLHACVHYTVCAP